MLNIITSNAGRASETFVESARADGEDNLAWLRRALGDLPAPEIEGTPTHLVLIGGRDQISFRLRVAQAHLRHDMTPSHWSHAALLGPVRNYARRTQTYEVSLEPAGGFGIPAATNALQVGRITTYADPDRYPNIALLRLPVDAALWQRATTREQISVLERFEKQRSVLDVTELVLQWLAFLWGVGRGRQSPAGGVRRADGGDDRGDPQRGRLRHHTRPGEPRELPRGDLAGGEVVASVLPGAEPGSDRWPMACRPADRPLDTGSLGYAPSLWPQPSGQFPVNGSDPIRSGPRSYAPARGCVSMAVQKAVDLTGTGASVDEAVAEAVDRAGMTLEGLTRFDVVSVSGTLDGRRLTYEAHVRVWFTLLERVHG